MNPDKDLEKELQHLEKKSKYAPLREVSQKIRQGIYQENAKQLKKNTKNLTKKAQKWQKKLERGNTKYKGKFEFAAGLLDLLQGKKKPKKEEEGDTTKLTEEDFALKKKIGEAALEVEKPNVKNQLTQLASLANELEGNVASQIKQLQEYKDTFDSKITNFKKGKFELTDSKDPIVIQGIANAARFFLEQQGKVDLYPVIRKPTLATGDCFYSAIYRSAKERGYLDDLEECLELDISDEKAFVQSLRNLIADEIINDRLPGTQTREGFLDTYDFLVQNYADNPQQYKVIIEGFPYWFQKKFAAGPGEKKKFLSEYASHTMTMTEWIGEIEFKIGERLLKSYCGIEIQNHYVSNDYNNSSNNDSNSNVEEKKIELPKIVNGVPVFHLVNLGEAHYEYYSFKIPISKIKKSTTVTTVKKKEEKKEDDPCGLIVYDPCTGFPIVEGDPITIIQNRLKTIQSKVKKGGTRKRR